MFKIYTEMKTGGATVAQNTFDNENYTFDLSCENGVIKGVFTAKKGPRNDGYISHGRRVCL